MRTITMALAATALGLLVVGSVMVVALNVFGAFSWQALVLFTISLFAGGYFAGFFVAIFCSLNRWGYLVIGPGPCMIFYIWLREKHPTSSMPWFYLFILLASLVGVLAGVGTARALRRLVGRTTADSSARP